MKSLAEKYGDSVEDFSFEGEEISSALSKKYGDQVEDYNFEDVVPAQVTRQEQQGMQSEQPQAQQQQPQGTSFLENAANLGAEFMAGVERGPLQLYDFMVTSPYNIAAQQFGFTQAKPVENIVRDATGGNLAAQKGTFAGEGFPTEIAGLAGEGFSAGGVFSKGARLIAGGLPESTAKNVSKVLAGRNASTEAALGAIAGAGAGAGGSVGEYVGGELAGDQGAEIGRGVGQLAGGFGASMASPRSLTAPKVYDFQAEVNDAAKKLMDGDPEHFAKVAQLDPKIVQLSEDAGFDADMSLSVASKNPYFKSVFGALSALPGKQTQKQWIQSTQELANKAQKTIAEMGAAPNASAMSKIYRNEMDDTIKNLYEKEKEISDMGRNLIPRTDRIAPNNTMALIQSEIIGHGGEMSMLTPEYRKVLKRLMPIDKGFKVDSFLSSSKKEIINPTYYNLDTNRRMIGDVLYKKGDNIFKNVPTAMLKKMYAALKQDQNDFAQQNYPEAFQHLKAADLLTQERKAAEKSMLDILGKTLSKDLMPVISTEVQNLAKGSFTQFEKTMNTIPKNLQSQVVATAIGETMNGRGLFEFSDNNFAKFYNKINKNTESRRALTQYMTKDQIKRFDNMGKLSDAMARQRQYVVKTGASLEAVRNSGSSFERLLPRIAGAALDNKLTRVFGANIIGKNIEDMLKGQFDRVDRADRLFSDPVFRKDVLKAHHELLTTGTIKTVARKTKKLDLWQKGLDAGQKEIINSIGVLPYLLQSDDEQQ